MRTTSWWRPHGSVTTMSEPEMQRVIAHVRYPDDPPLEMRYNADGSVEQLSGPPGIVMEMPVSDGPTMTVSIEHSPEGPTWTDLPLERKVGPDRPTQ